jgi:hypothetical protein
LEAPRAIAAAAAARVGVGDDSAGVGVLQRVFRAAAAAAGSVVVAVDLDVALECVVDVVVVGINDAGEDDDRGELKVAGGESSSLTDETLDVSLASSLDDDSVGSRRMVLARMCCCDVSPSKMLNDVDDVSVCRGLKRDIFVFCVHYEWK